MFPVIRMCYDPHNSLECLVDGIKIGGVGFSPYVNTICNIRLHNILQKDSNEMIRKIYDVQKTNTEKGQYSFLYG